MLRMGTRPRQPPDLRQREEGRLLAAVALVEQEEDEEEDSEEGSSGSGGSDSASRAEEGAKATKVPTFDVPYFRYIDEEESEGEGDGEEVWSSSRSLSSIEDDSSSDSVVSDRYVVVSGTPEKILEHLLSVLRLDNHRDDQGSTQQIKESGQSLTPANQYVWPLATTFNLC